jgi:gamma-glutamylcyclotransferase (GGCT)/AIG2-like uncharacterized protein YtfP
MIYFAYGLVPSAKENPFFSRNIEILAGYAWIKGILYDTGLGFPALTTGDETVYGMLVRMDEHTLETLLGIAKRYDSLNPPYTFKLKEVTVYSEVGASEALALMYESADGLTKIAHGSWF